MERQELFDRVATHLINQGEVCTGDAWVPTCRYRNRKGQKCAAGALIKDEFYSEELETNLASDPDVARALIASGVNPDDLNLVDRLQQVHDETDVDDWGPELILVAELYDLDIPGILK